MSAGAVFKLIANDGKADRMVMATKLLNQRIKDVMCARRQAGKADITPTLVDLERTHILYVSAHFKPFAAIGYEYNKVRPQAGNPTLGGGVTFSIPQFGDFFHDMVCRVRLSAFRANQGTAPNQGTGIFLANVGVGPVLDTYSLVDATGAAVTPGDTYRNFVRYCEFPGNRLFTKVKFDVNSNPLDEYDSLVALMLEKFCVSPNKRSGHDRLLGQEVPVSGYSGLIAAPVTDADIDNTPTGISKAKAGQSNQTVGLYPAALGLSTGQAIVDLNATAQVDVSRRVVQFVNGPQTPKPQQPPLEIWNKLRFWFNDDVRLSIASVSIPYGQRFITADLANKNLLAFEVPSIYVQRVSDTVATLSRRVTYQPYFVQNGIEDITVEKMELYINNIFVNPEIHDIYIKRIGFSLIRVYRQQVSRQNTDASGEQLLSSIKWPVEYMFVGLRPTWNIKDTTNLTGANAGRVSGNQNQWRDWHRLTRMVDAAADTPDRAEVSAGLAGGGSTSTTSRSRIQPDQYWLAVPTVDSLTLTSHGITIFDGFNDTFFNQYLPYQYGGANLTTPEDVGALFVNMALFPRSYNPSGHLNVSRARETYLKWTTSYVSSRTPVELIAIAVAINFLLITDGSAVLRYAT